MLSLRFADPQFELAYRRSERAKGGARARSLLLLGGAIVAGLVSLNPFMGRDAGDSIGVALAALGFLIFIAVMVPVTKTKAYLDHPILDLALCCVLAALMALLYGAMTAGWPPLSDQKYWLFVTYSGILLILTSTIFAASFLWFAIWVAVVALAAAIYLWALGVGGLVVLEYFATDAAIFFGFSLYTAWNRDRSARQIFEADAELVAERQKSETLLYNILPPTVAARLKAGGAVADAFGNASVTFIDMVGFSRLSKVLSPGHLVELLNNFFSAIDECAERCGVEKVKTIGDAYLAVAGGMASEKAGSLAALCFAKEVIEEVGRLAKQCDLPIRVRIGIHTGPVVGGVIGTNRMVYDYWGDTMNVASRLEGVAPENGIAVSESTFHQTKRVQPYDPPQTLILKGIGECQVYFARLQSSAGEHPFEAAAD